MVKTTLIYILGFILAGNVAFAQYTVKGKVMELHTDVMLSGITVDNLSQKASTRTDPMGNFTIKASKGDLLCFSGMNYVPDTLYLADTKNLIVKLVLRSNQLKEVQVTQHEINLGGGGWAAPPEKGVLNSKTVFYKPGGGMKIKLFDSHAGEKKRNKIAQLELNNERQQAIEQVFSPANLKNYIPLTGQELSNFIIKYTPSISQYYSSKFNLTEYISASYKEFLTIPEDKRKSPTYFQLDVKD